MQIARTNYHMGVCAMKTDSNMALHYFSEGLKAAFSLPISSIPLIELGKACLHIGDCLRMVDAELAKDYLKKTLEITKQVEDSKTEESAKSILRSMGVIEPVPEPESAADSSASEDDAPWDVQLGITTKQVVLPFNVLVGVVFID
jgi:hypothetical protein